jgi:CelD/BcsL family acetyltransferase involved in cellulose biosynthesis
LRAEWQALYRAAQAAPFLTWEWAATWHEWLNPNGTPVLLCARAAGQLIGLLALNEEPARVVGWPVQRLSFLGEGFGGADYLDVLARPGREAEVTAAILTFLTQQVSFDALELEGFDEQSHSLAWLAAQQPFQYRASGAVQKCSTRFFFLPSFFLPAIGHWLAGKKRAGKKGGVAGGALSHRSTRELYVCPQVDLTAGWDSVLKNSRRADNFKRRLRQLRARDGFAFRSVTDPAEAPAAFERFLHLHEARWAEAGGSEMTGHARLQSFHRGLVARFAAAGLLRFDELWVEGACRASIYGLEHQGRYYFYNSGYDQTWRNASVGLVGLGLSLEAAIARGNTAYDFLRGTESYKFDWAGATRATVAVRLTTPRLRARAFSFWQQTSTTLRKGVREAFPQSLLFSLQQARRAWVRHQELSRTPAAVPLRYE